MRRVVANAMYVPQRPLLDDDHTRFCGSLLLDHLSFLAGLQCEAAGNANCSNMGMLIWVAWGITFVIFLSLTAFVVLSKWDFSFMGMYLFAGSFILLGWGLVNMLLGYHSRYEK